VGRRRREHYLCDKTEHLRRLLKKKKKKKKKVMIVLIRAAMSLGSQSRVYLSCPFLLALKINLVNLVGIPTKRD
jgi:hypothetical protein